MLGEVWLATARARLGDLDPSRFDGPLAQARQAGSRMSEGLVRLQRGIALSGDEAHLPEALDDLAAAAGLFEQIGARPLHARALHAHGEALEVAGDHDEARSRFERATALFAELGITPDAHSRAVP
jgi:tetratricopeptide (TPR) repeat protein